MALKLARYLHASDQKPTEEDLIRALETLATHLKLKPAVFSAIRGADSSEYSLSKLEEFDLAGSDVERGENLVISNGRVIRLTEASSFLQDLHLINEFETKTQNVDKIASLIQDTQ